MDKTTNARAGENAQAVKITLAGCKAEIHLETPRDALELVSYVLRRCGVLASLHTAAVSQVGGDGLGDGEHCELAALIGETAEIGQAALHMLAFNRGEFREVQP